MTTSPDDSTMGTGNEAPAAAAVSGNAPDSPAGLPSKGGSSQAADELLDRVVRGAHAAIDRLAETAAPHVHRLQEGVGAAGDMLQSRAGRVRESGEAWAASLRSTVRENPLTAVGTALVLGMLVARLTRR